LISGIVFTRRGAGGEQDLFYYHPAGGTFELGGSTGLGIADLDKTFAKAWSRTSDGTRYVFVAFTVVNSGNAEIYGWTRTTGQTAAIAAGSDFTFRDLAGLATATPDAFAVYDDGQDLWSYDFDAGTALRIIDSSSSSTLLATTASATVAWGIAFDGTTPNTALAINLATGTTVSLAGGVGWASDRTLANGDVVIRGGSGTKLAAFDVSAGTWGTPIIGTGLDAVGDGIADGDFVYRQTVSSQTDLAMWDASAAASVTVSNTAGNDTFQGSSSGKVFFTRTTDGHEQLFVWNATSLAETQLTVTDSAGLDHDYSVLGTYAGAR